MNRSLALAPSTHMDTTDPAPTIGPRGELTYKGDTVCLSERNALIAGALLYHLETGLTDLELLTRVWPEGTSRWTMLRALGQLDRRLARVGLAVVAVGDRAHALRSLGAST